MAKAVADTDSQSNQGGFTYDGSRITGFSSLHDSGTGGQPSLGNYPLFPYVKCRDDDVNGCVYPKKQRKTSYISDSVKASPGYFGLTMESGIHVDMTVAHHTSLIRFQFPSDDNSSPLILLDLTDLSDTRQDNGTVSVDPTTGRMTGHARFQPSFGSGTYVPYFCVDFDSAANVRDHGVFINSRASTDVNHLDISRSINGYPLPVSPVPAPWCLELNGHRVVHLFGSNQPRTSRCRHELVSVSSAASRHAATPRPKSPILTLKLPIQWQLICGQKR